MRSSEKQILLSHQATPVQTQRRKSSTSFLAGLLLLVILWALFVLYDYVKEPHISYSNSDLKWTSCGEIGGRALECTRLDVPLDHFSDSRDKKHGFSIPLIRLIGRNATKSILLNPGGPGGSGFEFVHRRGQQLSTIIGDGYHLLSFDPRGVNGSIPKAICFPTQALREAARAAQPTDALGHFGQYSAYSANIAQSCEEVGGNIGKYVNTPQTAADMNLILDAIGQKEMYYWGFSYGTTLGQTYAQLFPDRSHRIIIDGVSNQDMWFESRKSGGDEEWKDTQATFKEMITSCFDSGSKACSLSEGFGTAEELYLNLTSAVESLKERPARVYVNSTTYGMLTYETVYSAAIFPALYKPTNWPIVVEDLRDFINGNATALYLKFEVQSSAWGSYDEEASIFVAVGDAARSDPSKKYTKEDIMDILEPIYEQSPMSAPGNAMELFYFDAWTIPRAHNFTPAEKVETAVPLLILSTTLDPVCPLRSAQAAERKYIGSVLLQQKGAGHCSVAMPSKCMAKHIRTFFNHGILPERNTICDIDIPYFSDPDQDFTPASHEDPEGEEFSRRLIELAREAEVPNWARV